MENSRGCNRKWDKHCAFIIIPMFAIFWKNASSQHLGDSGLETSMRSDLKEAEAGTILHEYIEGFYKTTIPPGEN